MRSVSRSVLLSFFALILVLATTINASAQLTATGVENPPSYDSFIPPSAGGTYADPVFGTNIKRVTNALSMSNNSAGSGTLTWIEAEYSTAAAFNTDNSKFILLHESYFGLYDGTTNSYIRDLPFEINASSEPRWGRKDNVTIYYHAGNMFKSYNISTGATAVVHTFSEYTSISGNGEMDISYDGDHFVLVGDTYNVFVYEISTDKKYTVLNTGGKAFDSVYISADNQVIISWYPAGTVRYTGQELFDINMNFLRQVGHADGHKHLTRDSNGAAVLIWTNSADPQPIANCQNGIVKITLSTGVQTCLAQLDWSLAVHITAPDGNGSAYVETYAPGNPESGTSAWVPYTNELLQVKLDGSGVTRLAHHRSRPWDSYLYMPKMTASRDGSRLLFASNYDLQKIDSYTTMYADTYLMQLTASSSTPTSPTPVSPTPVSPTPVAPAPAPTTTVVRHEQTDAAVKYTGTWYTNNGAYNSASSAAMAMDANSTASFTFIGTGVKWIGFSDPWSGISTVYLDGKAVATIDTYSATQKAQNVQYTASNLINTSHTLAIVATGTMDAKSAGAWVWVDAFDVTTVTGTQKPVTTTPVTTSLEQNNAAVSYSGSWFTNNGTFNSGSSSALAMDAGSSATLSFTGTAATWIGYSDAWSGIAQVYVDGTLVGTIDTYGAAQTAQKVQYGIANLKSGAHTLKITATGNHDTQSAGSWVWVDAFKVTN